MRRPYGFSTQLNLHFPPEIQLLDSSGKIVDQMESDKLPLEDLIVHYEKGMNLVKTRSVLKIDNADDLKT